MCQNYEKTMARYMGIVFGMSWHPLSLVSSATSILAEVELERIGFETFMPDIITARQEAVMRFYQKRTFALNMSGLLPYAGPVISVADVWGRGRFILRIAHEYSRNQSFLDDNWHSNIRELWPGFEPELWDGENIISFYQRTTGMAVPKEAHGIFITTLGRIGRIYRDRVKKIRGFETIQDHGEELVHRVFGRVNGGAKTVSHMVRKWFK